MLSNKIFILGPCALENRDMFFEVGRKIANLRFGHDWILKASFDKANRSSVKGQRGIGLEEALLIWNDFKKEYPHVKITTDVHECWQVEKLSQVIDIIQIPAFLSMQTDLVVECARHFNVVNIKKMQHLGPERMCVSVDKVKNTNPNCEAWLTDRGSNVGYYDLYVDFGAVGFYKDHFDKVILDATHSTQRSRKVYGNQSERELCKKYFLSTSIYGYDGVFAEVHPNPPEAVSDADSQIYLSDMPELLRKFDAIEEICGK
jgi:2-dehydro-3-deoxyphosphooctonate aldolase (KDO 8-P synthase)